MSKIKVKVLEVVQGFYDESYGPIYTPQEQSEWEEVTLEELDVLKRWADNQNKSGRPPYVVVFTEMQINVRQTIKQYLAQAKEQLEAIAEKERKKKEAEKERKNKKETKTQAKEKAKLKELLKKYPDISAQ